MASHHGALASVIIDSLAYLSLLGVLLITFRRYHTHKSAEVAAAVAHAKSARRRPADEDGDDPPPGSPISPHGGMTQVGGPASVRAAAGDEAVSGVATRARRADRRNGSGPLSRFSEQSALADLTLGSSNYYADAFASAASADEQERGHTSDAGAPEGRLDSRWVATVAGSVGAAGMRYLQSSASRLRVAEHQDARAGRDDCMNREGRRARTTRALRGREENAAKGREKGIVRTDRTGVKARTWKAIDEWEAPDFPGVQGGGSSVTVVENALVLDSTEMAGQYPRSASSMDHVRGTSPYVPTHKAQCARAGHMQRNAPALPVHPGRTKGWEGFSGDGSDQHLGETVRGARRADKLTEYVVSAASDSPPNWGSSKDDPLTV
ncbi:uncharacterized protein B0H18DRAFT_1120491 [Fomitopsis serialis]|uniref:uncharacterized protein n=1 Tax=Fomitopsis serialis TaxID=139415 RepID=UPI0020086AF5|nr:uncharacterized protein B0H18DRAFT_1120491 [Neoantrodia serialis]KAH9923224.1 hypothetical protein B0H18DRAFT_1120491 [Neoantrodia serialis]